MFAPKTDPDVVIIDFIASRVADQSALQAIEDVAAKYEAEGKAVQLRHLSKGCRALLHNAGQLVVEAEDDPDYGIAVDYGVQTGRLAGGH